MPIEPKISDLIHSEIDGLISTEDQVLLDQHLQGDAEARAYHGELTALCGELQSMPAITPPPDIRQSVLEHTGGSAGIAGEPATGRWITLFNGFFGAGPLRYAISFAAGAVMTMALVSSDQISHKAFDDVTDLVGTMSDPAASNDAEILDSMPLAINELAGSVTMSRVGSLMILDFDLSSMGPVEIVAQFSNRDIWFNGFAQLESSGTSIAAETGRVIIRMEGQRRYAVYLNNTGLNSASVNLQFFSSGKLLHEGELSFEKSN